MTYRHLLGAGALFVSVTITACAKQPPPEAAAPEAAVKEAATGQRNSGLALAGPATKPAEGDSKVVTGAAHDIPAAETASYSEKLERLLAERAAEGAAAPATNPASGASAPPATQPAAQPAAARENQATIQQLLEGSPATANRATKIPVANGQVAVQPQPVIDVKPPPPAQQPKHPGDLNATVSEPLARKLSERLKADPLDVSAHLDYQLLQFVNGQTVPEMNAIAPLPQEEREIVTAVLDGLSNFRTGIRTGGNALLGQKVRPLIDMGERIRTQSTFAIENLVLCREVTQFGVYQPFASPRFPFGEQHPVVVYCEVANFTSQLNPKNVWETKLQHEVLLYADSDGSLPVWHQKPTPVVDQCHSRRRDFFIAKLLELPQDLPVGGYRMKVSLVDETANRIAEATVPLHIAGK